MIAQIIFNLVLVVAEEFHYIIVNDLNGYFNILRRSTEVTSSDVLYLGSGVKNAIKRLSGFIKREESEIFRADDVAVLIFVSGCVFVNRAFSIPYFSIFCISSRRVIIFDAKWVTKLIRDLFSWLLLFLRCKRQIEHRIEPLSVWVEVKKLLVVFEEFKVRTLLGKFLSNFVVQTPELVNVF